MYQLCLVIAMSLAKYFQSLIDKVENSDVIQNDGKDDNGFYKPKRTILINHLNMLRDLHAKPNAKPMLKTAWKVVTDTLPPEWLVLNEEDKIELRKMLS